MGRMHRAQSTQHMNKHTTITQLNKNYFSLLFHFIKCFLNLKIEEVSLTRDHHWVVAFAHDILLIVVVFIFPYARWRSQTKRNNKLSNTIYYKFSCLPNSKFVIVAASAVMVSHLHLELCLVSAYICVCVSVSYLFLFTFLSFFFIVFIIHRVLVFMFL